MAEKYTGKIDRNTDWGGDASTGYLPVAGSSVQEFIKGELNSKVGAIYKPEGSNVVYYFANEDDKAAYIETGDESYILDSMELASRYSVKIDPETLVLSHSVIYGATGNTAEFGFKIVDENEMSADAKASIEFSFTGSGISNKFTTEIPIVAGDWTRVSVNIDDYLRKGSNSVAIKITGISTQASTQFVMTYNLFDLMFEPSFGYNIGQTGNTISVPYIIECSDTKYLEFYIDGVSVESSESMVIPDIRVDSRATINISNLSIGQHTLQFRAYVKATDGTIFYTPSHYYTFAKVGDTTPSFLMHMIVDNTVPIFTPGENFKMTIEQFTNIMFDWSLYDFKNRKLAVQFEYNGTVVGTTVVEENGTVNTFSYRPMDFGEGKTLRVFALGEEGELIFEYFIYIDVTEATGGIKETTDGLLLKLQSNGRRNTDEDKDVWECIGSDGNRYYATFSGFSWNSQQGWNEETESLVISNGAVVNFNIQPMKDNWVRTGGAIEIDLETFDIENEDAVICECANNLGDDEAFFRITATQAEFSTANHVSIETRYKDNERLKIAFIGNRAGPHDDGYLIYIVVNGVLERAALYKDGDSMYSFANLSIGDPTGQCKVRLRSIRVYDRAISVDQAFNNYVVDSDNVQELYEKNNVLKAGSSTEIGFDEVANKLPVMIFTGDMKELVDNGQDKEWRQFDVEYINRQEPERNFVTFNCRLKLQGTSSLGYPRKNFKLNTKDKYFDEELYKSSKYELDPNSVTGNLMLRNKITGEQIDFEDFKTGGRLNNTYCFTLDYQGNALKKGKYRFRKDAHKAQKWTLKADFMESSCSHNVAAGRSWNDIFENTPLLSNGDASYTNNTYKDSALVSQDEYIDYVREDGVHCRIENNTDGIKRQKDYVCRTDAQKRCISAEQDDIRTAVDGFPMVCFYRTSHASNDLVFMGQYNFINDKASYEVFGFEDIEAPEDENTMIYDASKVECWEGLKNTNPLSLFITDEGFYDWNADRTLRKWQETYEARYPDPEDVESDPSCVYELTKWLVSTRHVSGETEYSGTIDIDASFAKRINTYQYGYTNDTATGYTYAEGVGLEDNAENRQKKFETEKWEHFDVWKLAGYYIYLMRYGAVDQFVKNTMLFTDGNGRYDPRTDKKYRKWFFINYDNDCLFGLRNNGQLAFYWDLNRQTIDSASDIIIDPEAGDESGSTNSYAMMGHDSTLWNNLEQDDEFMRMVRDLDYSMTKYKLNYNNMVKEFDTDQTEKWCERIYNSNERYKYIDAAKGIGDMEGKAVNNLWMLQGTRRSHRHWWVANHFNLLDAQWLSGDYKNTYVEIKTNCPAGTSIRAKAGAKYYFAWGQQKKIYESNMVRNEGEDIVFSFPTNQSQGDPVYIYVFNKMTEMDFSALARDVFEGSFKFVLGTDLVQNTMKKLIIGNPSIRNATAQDTTTWANLPNLEYLDITNYEGITSVPFRAFNNLHTFKANGSKLGAFDPAEGSVFERVELPSSIKTLSLVDVSFKNNISTDFVYTPNTNLDSLTLSNANSAGIDRSYYDRIIRPWIAAIDASPQAALLYKGKSLTLRNVKWAFNNLDYIRVFKPFLTAQTFKITGVIDLRTCGNLPMSAIEEIKEIFGENCFNEKLSPIYVITPDSVFINSDRTEMVAGDTNVFTRTIYPDERAVIEKLQELKYYIVEETTRTKEEELPGEIIFEDPITGKNYLVINDTEAIRHGLVLQNSLDINGRQIGILTCDEMVEQPETVIKVLVYMELIGSTFDKVSVMDFTIKDPTYASSATISGEKSLYKNKVYKFWLSPKTSDGQEPIGTYSVDWAISGTGVEEYVESAKVNPLNKLEYVVTMSSDQPEISSKMKIYAEIHSYDGTSVACDFDTLALNETVIMTTDSNPVVMAICRREGWASDENAMKMSEAAEVEDLGMAFAGISDGFTFHEFRYFTNVQSLQNGAFSASNIEEIIFPDSVKTIGQYCFDGCSSLTGVYSVVDHGTEYERNERLLPPQIKSIDEGVFKGCSSLSELSLPEGVTIIRNYAFGGTGFESVILPSSEISSGCLRLPSTLESIEANAFETETWSPTTTTNRLKRLEIPVATTVNEVVFRGRNYTDFVVEEGHLMYMVSEDGVLMDANGSTMLRYPPMGASAETYVLPPVQVVSRFAMFAVKTVENIIAGENSPIQAIQEGFCMDSDVITVDLSNCTTLSVNEIPNSAFRNCRNLNSFIFPRGTAIKTIGMYAFENCVSLPELNFPDSLEGFATNARGFSYAISNCQSISALTFPNSVTMMGTATIHNCDNLVDIVFPAYLDYTQYSKRDIEEYGFHSDQFAIVSGCSNITGVTLPAFSIDVEEDGEIVSKTINRNLFNDRHFMRNTPNEDYTNPADQYWHNMVVRGLPIIIDGGSNWWSDVYHVIEYRLPEVDNGNEYVSISGWIYTANEKRVCGIPKGISKISIPNGTEEIGSYVMDDEDRHHTHSIELEIPDSIRLIGDGAFNRADVANDITIGGEGMLRIGEDAFTESTFKNLTINRPLTVGQSGFKNCSRLINVVLNGNATLEREAFNGCDNIEHVTIKGNTTLNGSSFRNPSKIKSLTVIVDEGVVPTFNNFTVQVFPFYQIGKNYPKAQRKLLVSVGSSELFTSAVRRQYLDWHYVLTGERLDGVIEDYDGMTIEEAIPAPNEVDVKAYVGGVEYTSTIYATSSLGHLVGEGGGVYSINPIGGKYKFELDGVYDGEEITLYSDSSLTNEIGRFTPRALTYEYQVGEPLMGMRTFRAAPVVLGSPADDEIVSIKKSEYESLVSKVNQMMRLMNKIFK